MVEKKHRKSRSDWELESTFDAAATLEELINSPPFKESSGESGESITAGTRIPTWLHRRVVKLKEVQGSPYELNSDVLRDAVYVGLRILHMRFKMAKDWNVETKMAAIADAVGAGKRMRSQTRELTDGLEELCRDGDYDHAAERLTEYVLAAEELENNWHRKKVFSMLNGERVVRDVLKYCRKEVAQIVEKEAK